MALHGKVCLVTGATRGIGRGIALQLGESGATVYITGRTLKASEGSKGSLEDTAKEIEDRGGKCIPVQCDHSDDHQVVQLFERIGREQNSRLDVLVNNAYTAVTAIFDSISDKASFWEQDPKIWDTVNHVGLRNHYLCSVYAARMMVPAKQGLIVNISSVGGLKYLFNVAYGIGKAAVDRMAADCAIELKKSNVAYVSLWPGAVKTELMVGFSEDREYIKGMLETAETVEFSGKCITALALDPNIMKKSGRILLTSELAEEYNIVDLDGTLPDSMRSLRTLLRFTGWRATADWCPRWLKLPYWTLTVFASKF
ncbi:PREDICTED: dehydrogenase/reductase SDR family member 1-like [Priapulus caudatus]|uniref:Dehydrogenase/reductase SDR family member 1-like n=1 Tax=Priapulus caudatus TaxID=37621 RepID=A0ABM1E2X4_PRICU|nr:PREDICTED: dehydrogenase/reductase SDR family member 1-like [Priapulus caudatus]XP_014666545.1 PREDICTED: dehydrogenase/reductase SDR family member 1-like [Priapulus caudatus]XP_014666546.1 PREDICTED: dehydrogenase/reductase SDR family member 1-like [Priapulus caudatus]